MSPVNELINLDEADRLSPSEILASETLAEESTTDLPGDTTRIRNINRRDFLKLLAAPLAMAGLSACLPQPNELIVPYVEAPENLIPGKPIFYATAMELDGFARGLLVESNMGRPVKIEGNPDHPASLGATDAFAQASILDLYDPARARDITSQGKKSTWDEFLKAIAAALDTQHGKQGAGLRLLTGTITSPTLAAQINALLEQFPQAKWHQYDPIGRDNIRSATLKSFGQVAEPVYDFSKADVILSLDSDFLACEPGSLRYNREFASRRQPLDDGKTMNRLYVIESGLSITGATADHNLPVQASEVEAIAREIANRLGLSVSTPGIRPNFETWISALVSDLQAHTGTSLVLAGLQQPPLVHQLAYAINAQMGNQGNTIIYLGPVEPQPVDQRESIRALADDLKAGKVDLLIILSENPAYNTPVDLDMTQAIPKAGLSIYLGSYQDETAAICTWHIPAAHYLESWSDTRAFDGTVSIIQPLIQPLYDGHTRHELMNVILGQPQATGYEVIRQVWLSLFSQKGGTGGQTADQTTPAVVNVEFEAFWRQALKDGSVPNTTSPRVEVTAQLDFHAEAAPASLAVEANGLEIIFKSDPSIRDGCFSNNVWLQELPKPFTKLTWDNAALISPSTAAELGLANEQVVELTYQGRSGKVPVWILPGMPDRSVVVHLGYGKQNQPGKEGQSGFNAYTLRTLDSPWFGTGLQLRKTGQKYLLASTQQHFSPEGKNLVRAGTLQEYQKNPTFAQDEQPGAPAKTPGTGEPTSLFPTIEYSGHAWGMAINLNTCTGCNACIIACQAENNIPVVGKDQVRRRREMHWLRVDHYFPEEPSAPAVLQQLVLCMHCEDAPCEPVCPVGATIHSPEGLNEMVYNRCIGTRYCSNNCPYKVRRFNFYRFVDKDSESLKLLRNPNVTVRERGVMEKCSYCVQRINAARIESEISGHPIQDGDVVPACAQACPTEAILFGDINDPESRVRKAKDQPLNYSLLAELGIQPRTTYLARVRNLNPEIPV